MMKGDAEISDVNRPFTEGNNTLHESIICHFNILKRTHSFMDLAGIKTIRINNHRIY